MPDLQVVLKKTIHTKAKEAKKDKSRNYFDYFCNTLYNVIFYYYKIIRNLRYGNT